MSRAQEEPIRVRGARVHNLKGVDCDLPRNRLVVITGPSGSGKSSLAFDTLFAEGQRRYLATLSAHARPFVGLLDKPDVDEITGLCPAIAIDQRAAISHPRSTVGTASEVHDPLRVLLAALGRPHCPRCGDLVSGQSAELIAERLSRGPEGAAIAILAPVVRDRKGAFREEIQALATRGHVRARVDGKGRNLREALDLDPRQNHRIDVLVDRLIVRPAARARIEAAVAKALDLAEDIALVSFEGGSEQVFSRRHACIRCGLSLPELLPRSFSFNSEHGACPSCRGLGERLVVDRDTLIPDESRSLLRGAIAPWRRHGTRLLREALEEMSIRHAIALDRPVRELHRGARAVLLEGDGQGFPGVIPALERRLSTLVETEAARGKTRAGREAAAELQALRPYLQEKACATCEGTRLRVESLAVRLAGIPVRDLLRLSVAAAREALATLSFPERERPVAERVRGEIVGRLGQLEALGLGYLTLDRATRSLSSGEAQRIRLATQIGARMQGLLYVLDEPSVGLHPRDNEKLLAALRRVRDLGNSVVVVEHDLEAIRAADWLIDLGLGAGPAGGRLLYQGPPASVDGSLTGRYLRGEMGIAVPQVRRAARGWIRIEGARAHNLKGIDVSFPLGALSVVTGVSGAGKSSLVLGVLERGLRWQLGGGGPEPGPHRTLAGAEGISRVLSIDQTPIGRTPRSNPATYTGAFAHIRLLFSLTPEARARGFKATRFSFNVKGGRCEACRGDGVRRIAMHLLPDASVPCEECRGTRYDRETLGVLYRGRTVAEILSLAVSDAHPLLAAHPRLDRILGTMIDVGLGYLTLGQSATTLSGGEAQRVRLARELSRADTGATLYVFDEPTTGLHPADIERLLRVLGRLVDAGDTVVLIEHNLDVIKAADHVVDLGPEAGDAGGFVVVQGTPEAVARCPASHTGRFLAPLLRQA